MADPLFPFLTLRLVLFLAAGLELGVAGVLLRHRQARWAPGLILWLVLVFGGGVGLVAALGTARVADARAGPPRSTSARTTAGVLGPLTWKL